MTGSKCRWISSATFAPPLVDHRLSHAHELFVASFQLRDDACQDSDSVSKQRAVGGVVDVRFDGCRINAQLAPWSDALAVALLDNLQVHVASEVVAENGEGASEGRVFGNLVTIESGELPVRDVVGELVLQLSKGPTPDVLECATSQRAVWSHALATSACRSRRPRAQGALGPSNHGRVVKNGVDFA